MSSLLAAARRDALSSSSLSSLSSSSSNGSHTPHELLFENRTVSLILLLLSFVWTLTSVLAPSLCMRQEQFSRLQVRVMGVWHAFAAGLLLSAAFMLFLPNMLAVADVMQLPTPALPFMLLFISMLVPLALDKLMLWLCTRKADVGQAGGEAGSEWGGATPRGDERSSSQPSTPRMVMTPQLPPLSGSRRGSTALTGGYQAESAYAEERKAAARSMITRGVRGTESEPLSGNDIESHPLITPKGTPRGPVAHSGPSSTPTRSTWYGSSAARSVDASDFKLKQSYIARCALCKDNISSSKGVAYHGAGCPLKSFHAFSFSSRWMQGLRGRRSLQRDIVMHDEAAAGGEATLGGPGAPVGWSLACYVLVLSVYNLCLAGGINLQEAARLYSHAHVSTEDSDASAAEAHASWLGEVGRVGLVALVMCCFTGFYGFSLGMMLALHRVPRTSWKSLLAMTVYSLSLPGAIGLNYLLSNYANDSGAHAYSMYLLVCQCCGVGILIYAAFLDLLLEEWARRDAMWGKYGGFAVGAAIVIALTIWAPL